VDLKLVRALGISVAEFDDGGPDAPKRLKK
jgi:hypothetical protein